MNINKLTCIWSNNQHNAFTDLIYFKHRFFCCFRQASNHISPDGQIQILSSDNGINWQLTCSIKEDLADLRDPKLSINSQDQMQLLYYRKRFLKKDGKIHNIANENCISFSQNGISFSQAKIVGENNWWLWRTIPTPAPQIAQLGIAYNRSANRVKLMSSVSRCNSNANFNVYLDNFFGLSQNGKGYPNESDILFAADNSAYCILRRDADSFTAQLGVAQYPYKQWRWFDLGEYLGGPKLLQLPDGRIIIAARRFFPQRKKLRLTTCLLELQHAHSRFKLKPLLELPSGGDNSYPGMCYHQDKLYVSYYSQHQHRAHEPRCDIFFAEIKTD